MIEEIKNFDLKLFLCFLEIIHDEIICETVSYTHLENVR